jgi:hypothetical protein
MWYLPIMLLLLRIWQDVFYTMTVHTIPYSEFKDHVAKGDVVECDVKEDEIVGLIRLKASQERQSTAKSRECAALSSTKPAATPPRVPADQKTGSGGSGPSRI